MIQILPTGLETRPHIKLGQNDVKLNKHHVFYGISKAGDPELWNDVYDQIQCQIFEFRPTWSLRI